MFYSFACIHLHISHTCYLVYAKKIVLAIPSDFTRVTDLIKQKTIRLMCVTVCIGLRWPDQSHETTDARLRTKCNLYISVSQ